MSTQDTQANNYNQSSNFDNRLQPIHHRSFQKGDRIVLNDGREATVKFEGSVLFSSGYFIGIALDEPTGKHDGRSLVIHSFIHPFIYLFPS